jgi:hypothetical protein
LQEHDLCNQVKEGLQKKTKERRYEGNQISVDELLMYKSRLYVPDSANRRHLIMDEFHRRAYVSHPGYQNMVTIVR